MQVKVYFSFLMLVVFSQGCSSLFFYPDKTVYRTPDFYNFKYENIYFNSLDKTPLHAWRIYPSTQSKGLVFVAHGNAQNLSSHFAGWTWLIKEGYELFIFDYRGYGKSEGKTDIKGSIEDTKAALSYVEKVYQDEYIVAGQSLGGTLLLNALSERENNKIQAVVIDSTFVGFSDITSSKMNDIWLTWPFQWVPYLSLSDKYDAKDKVGNLNKPILFVHGSLDQIVSINNSWQLFELSSPAKEFWIVKNAGHIQGFENKNVQDDFLEFIQKGSHYYNPHYSRMKIYE